MYGAIFPNNIILVAFLLHNLSTCRAIINLDSTFKYFNSPKFSLAMKYLTDDLAKYVRTIASDLATSVASRTKEFYDNVDPHDSAVLTGSYLFQKQSKSKLNDRLLKGRSKADADNLSTKTDRKLGVTRLEETLPANGDNSEEVGEGKSFSENTTNKATEIEELNNFEPVPKGRIDHRKMRKNSTSRKNSRQRVHSLVLNNASDSKSATVKHLIGNILQFSVKINDTHDRTSLINPATEDVSRRNERVQQNKTGPGIKTGVSDTSKRIGLDVQSNYRKMQVTSPIGMRGSYDSVISKQNRSKQKLLDFVNPEIINYIRRNRLDLSTAHPSSVKWSKEKTTFGRSKLPNLKGASNLTHFDRVNSSAHIDASKIARKNGAHVPLRKINFVNSKFVNNIREDNSSLPIELESTASRRLRPKIVNNTKNISITIQREVNLSTRIPITHSEQDNITEAPINDLTSTANVGEEFNLFVRINNLSQGAMVEGENGNNLFQMNGIEVTSAKSEYLEIISSNEETNHTQEDIGNATESNKLPQSNAVISSLSKNPLNRREQILSMNLATPGVLLNVSIHDTSSKTPSLSSKSEEGNVKVDRATVTPEVVGVISYENTLREDKQVDTLILGTAELKSPGDSESSKEIHNDKVELIIDSIEMPQNITVMLPNFPGFEPDIEKMEGSPLSKFGANQFNAPATKKNTDKIHSETLVDGTEKLGFEARIGQEGSYENAKKFQNPEVNVDDAVKFPSLITKENEIFEATSLGRDLNSTGTEQSTSSFATSTPIHMNEQVNEILKNIVKNENVNNSGTIENAAEIDAELNYTSLPISIPRLQDEIIRGSLPSKDTSFIKSQTANGGTPSIVLNGGIATENYGLFNRTPRIVIRKDKLGNRNSARSHRILSKSRIKKRAAKDTFMNIIESRWSEVNNEEAEYEEMSTDDAQYDDRLEYDVTERYRCPNTKVLEDQDPRGLFVRSDKDLSLQKEFNEGVLPGQEDIFAKLSEICASLKSVSRKNKTTMIYYDHRPVVQEKARLTTTSLLPKLKRSFREKRNETRRNAREKLRKWNKQSESPIDLEAESDRLLDLALGKFEDKLKSIIQSNWPRRNVRDPTQTIHHSHMKRKSNGTLTTNINSDSNRTTEQYQKEEPSLQMVVEVEMPVEEEVTTTETLSVHLEAISQKSSTVTNLEEQGKTTAKENKSSKSPSDADKIDEQRRALTYSTSQREEYKRLNYSESPQGENEGLVVSANNFVKNPDRTATDLINYKINAPTDESTINRLGTFRKSILSSFRNDDRNFDQGEPHYPRLQLPITASRYSDPIRNSAPASSQPNKFRNSPIDDETQYNLENVPLHSAEPTTSNFMDSNATSLKFEDKDNLKSTIGTRSHPNKENIMKLNRKLGKIISIPGEASVTYSQSPQSLQKSIENFKKIAKLNWELLKNIEADESFSISEFNSAVLDSPPSSTEYAESFSMPEFNPAVLDSPSSSTEYAESLHLHTNEFVEEEVATSPPTGNWNVTRKIFVPLKTVPQNLQIDSSQAQLQRHKQYHHTHTGQKSFANSDGSAPKQEDAAKHVLETHDFVQENASKRHYSRQNSNIFHSNKHDVSLTEPHNFSITTQKNRNPDPALSPGDQSFTERREQHQDTLLDQDIPTTIGNNEETEEEFSGQNHRQKFDHETRVSVQDLIPGEEIRPESSSLNKNYSLSNESELSEHSPVHVQHETRANEQNHTQTDISGFEIGLNQEGSDWNQLEIPESTIQQEYVTERVDPRECDEFSTSDESSIRQNPPLVKSNCRHTNPSHYSINTLDVSKSESTTIPHLFQEMESSYPPLQNKKLVLNHSPSPRKFTMTANDNPDADQPFVNSPNLEDLFAISKHNNTTKLTDGTFITLKMSQQLELKATPAQIEQIRRGITKSGGFIEGRRATTHGLPNTYVTSDSRSYSLRFMDPLQRKSSDLRHYTIDTIDGLQYQDSLGMEHHQRESPRTEESRVENYSQRTHHWNLLATDHRSEMNRSSENRETKSFTEKSQMKEAANKMKTWKGSIKESQNDSLLYYSTNSSESRNVELQKTEQQNRVTDETDYENQTAKLPSHKTSTTLQYTDKIQEDGKLSDNRYQSNKPPSKRPSRKRQRGKTTDLHRYKVFPVPERQTITTVPLRDDTDEPSNREIFTRTPSEKSQREHNTLAIRYQTDKPGTKKPLRKKPKSETARPHRYTILERPEQQIVITVMGHTTAQNEILTDKSLYAEESGKHKIVDTGNQMDELSSKRATRKRTEGRKIERLHSKDLIQTEMQTITAETNNHSMESSYPAKQDIENSLEIKQTSEVQKSTSESAYKHPFRKRKRGKQIRFYNRIKPKRYGERKSMVFIDEGETTATFTPLSRAPAPKIGGGSSSERDDTDHTFRSSSIEEQRNHELRRRDRKSKQRRVTTLRGVDQDNEE